MRQPLSNRYPHPARRLIRAKPRNHGWVYWLTNLAMSSLVVMAIWAIISPG